MKKLLILPLLLIFISMVAPKKNRIVFFGDSITQMGTNEGGYITRIQNAVNKNGTGNKYELLGSGIGYNKIYDLYLRMDEDVMAKKPSLVVIYIGINDVGHKYSTRTGTDIDKYEKFYIAIIKKLQEKKIKVVVCTPTVLGEKKDNENPQDKELDAYSAVIRKLAVSMNCTLIDLRKAFIAYEKMNNHDNKESGLLTTDGIHLTDAGNQLVADEMIKALNIQ